MHLGGILESLAVSASSTRTRKGVVKYSVVSLRSHSGEASSGYDAGSVTEIGGTGERNRCLLFLMEISCKIHFWYNVNNTQIIISHVISALIFSIWTWNRRI